MVAQPVNYNSKAQSIAVDPDSLWTQAKVTLPAQTETVVTILSSISTTWNDLKLSWFGKTADDAKRFNDEWHTVMNQLFGPEDVNAEVLPGQAILPKIAGGAAVAARNFGHAEDAVIQTFQPFIDAKPGAPGSGRDSQSGPITETNTPKSPGN